MAWLKNTFRSMEDRKRDEELTGRLSPNQREEMVNRTNIRSGVAQPGKFEVFVTNYLEKIEAPDISSSFP